jgi:hypothetical protein
VNKNSSAKSERSKRWRQASFLSAILYLYRILFASLLSFQLEPLPWGRARGTLDAYCPTSVPRHPPPDAHRCCSNIPSVRRSHVTRHFRPTYRRREGGHRDQGRSYRLVRCMVYGCVWCFMMRLGGEGIKLARCLSLVAIPILLSLSTPSRPSSGNEVQERSEADAPGSYSTTHHLHPPHPPPPNSPYSPLAPSPYCQHGARW